MNSPFANYFDVSNYLNNIKNDIEKTHNILTLYETYARFETYIENLDSSFRYDKNISKLIEDIKNSFIKISGTAQKTSSEILNKMPKSELMEASIMYSLDSLKEVQNAIETISDPAVLLDRKIQVDTYLGNIPEKYKKDPRMFECIQKITFMFEDKLTKLLEPQPLTNDDVANQAIEALEKINSITYKTNDLGEIVRKKKKSEEYFKSLDPLIKINEKVRNMVDNVRTSYDKRIAYLSSVYEPKIYKEKKTI